MNWFDWLNDLLGSYEVGGNIWWTEIGRFVCALSDTFCLYSETWLYTSDSSYEEWDRFQVYMGHAF